MLHNLKMLALIAVVAGLAGSYPRLESSAAESPNILFIFTDDHAPHAIGAYGGWLKGVNPTPNIELSATVAETLVATAPKLPTSHTPSTP